MKSKYLSIQILLMALILMMTLQGQEQRIKFQHITLEDGLSQSTIHCISQDSRGFMWFATEDGLNRYDGYNFTVYRQIPGDPDSLSNNDIKSLYESPKDPNILWIGTVKGLNKFDLEKEEFVRYLNDPNNPNSLNHNYIRAIYEDHLGMLWVGTDGGGLNKYNQQKDIFTFYQHDPYNHAGLSSNVVYVIYEDKQDQLWIGTKNGLNKFDRQKEIFNRYHHDSNDPNSLSHNKVKSILEDREGGLWIGTDGGGLDKFDRQKEIFFHHRHDPYKPNSLSDNNVYAVIEDHSGVFWIASYGGGVNRFDGKKFTHFQNDPKDPYSLSSSSIWSIYEDNSGVIWVGTYGSGLSKFNREKKKFLLYRNFAATGCSVRCFYEESSDLLWVGSDGNGIFQFRDDNHNNEIVDNYQHNPKDPNSLSHNRVFSIYEDSLGEFWIGTYGGLDNFDRKEKIFIHYQNDSNDPKSLSSNHIRVIYEDHLGNFWIATDGGGLNKFDRKRKTFTHYQNDPNDPNSLSNNRIRTLYEDQSDFLWIGTYGGGLNKFDHQREIFIRYQNDPNDPQSLSHDCVISLFEDHTGAFWIGTFGGGLNKFDRDKETFSYYNEKDGLPNNVIYGILEDENANFWLSTNKGLSRFNPKTESFKNYTVADGLQSNEFNGGAFYKGRKGKMFFGGLNGFNAFFPKEICDNPYIPQVVIIDFQLLNKSVPIGEIWDGRVILKKSIIETEKIVLSYKDHVFSFEFAALHYVSPEKNQYAYKMEGLEKEWNYVGARRFVTYTNLSPGEYIFKVKAANNDGVWNEEGTSLRIIIHPPFWQTWWFYLLCAIGIMFSVFWVYRLRVNQLKKKKRELERLVNERTLQLKKANKELEKLSIVASETDNAVIIMDPEGNIEWINEGFTRIYEDTLEQLINERGKNLIVSSSNPNIKDALNRCITKKKAVTYESLNKTRSGKEIWAQTTLTPILDYDGNVEKIIAIDSDITALKKANESAGKERKTAERANRSKSEFLARMSHEIRTPMNGVIGFTDMLLDTELNEEQIDYARTISKSGEALLTLLNDILDLSKIEAGELSFDPINFDPEIILFDVCDLIKPRIGAKNIELLCRIGENIPAYVRSDAGRFRQVIVNLMGNAAKFTEEGEIELSLDVEKEEKEKLKLHVMVRDTGIGIPDDKINNVFESFQQVDGSNTRKYEGTGLGLTICKQIANLLGGDVWVESEYGKGSTFHFTCWVEKSKKESDKETIHDYLTGKRALIVDDNPTNIAILSHTLELSKMKVVKVLHANEAIPVIIKHFKNNKSFDICIIDIQMPGFSGYDLAKEIRNHQPPISDIPLLAFSSSTESRLKKFQDAGFNGFLPKPIQRIQLLKMIERLLVLETDKEKAGKKELITQHTIVEESKHYIHILLAEDNPQSLKLALYMLKNAGYRVTVARDGEETIEIFISDPKKYDVILMDIQMPKIDGRKVTRILRNKGFKDIPIIAMTAEAMKGDRERCFEAGMDDYIPKPIRRHVVFKILKKWCWKKYTESK